MGSFAVRVAILLHSSVQQISVSVHSRNHIKRFTVLVKRLRVGAIQISSNDFENPPNKHAVQFLLIKKRFHKIYWFR